MGSLAALSRTLFQAPYLISSTRFLITHKKAAEQKHFTFQKFFEGQKSSYMLPTFRSALDSLFTMRRAALYGVLEAACSDFVVPFGWGREAGLGKAVWVKTEP